MRDSAAGLIALLFGRSLRGVMTDENRPQSETHPASSNPARETGNISERVQVLRQKTGDLSQTLARIEETLREAQRDSKE